MNKLLNITAATLATTALALSDGTPVEGVKITSKNRIQVRVPASHELGAADPLRIFNRDGTHYKGQTGNLTLTVVDAPASAADAPVAAAPAAAPAASNDNVTYQVNGADFSSLDEAREEAIDIYDGTNNVDIIAVTTKVIGTVGFTLAA